MMARPKSMSKPNQSTFSRNLSGRGGGGGGRCGTFAVYGNDVLGQSRPTSPAPAVGNNTSNQANNSLIHLLTQLQPGGNRYRYGIPPPPSFLPRGGRGRESDPGVFAPIFQFPTPLPNSSSNLGWLINNTTDANGQPVLRHRIVRFFEPCFYCQENFTSLDMSYAHMREIHGWRGTALCQSTQSTQTHEKSFEQFQQQQQQPPTEADDPEVLNDFVQENEGQQGQSQGQPGNATAIRLMFNQDLHTSWLHEVASDICGVERQEGLRVQALANLSLLDQNQNPMDLTMGPRPNPNLGAAGQSDVGNLSIPDLEPNLGGNNGKRASVDLPDIYEPPNKRPVSPQPHCLHCMYHGGSPSEFMEENYRQLDIESVCPCCDKCRDENGNGNVEARREPESDSSDASIVVVEAENEDLFAANQLITPNMNNGQQNQEMEIPSPNPKENETPLKVLHPEAWKKGFKDVPNDNDSSTSSTMSEPEPSTSQQQQQQVPRGSRGRGGRGRGRGLTTRLTLARIVTCSKCKRTFSGPNFSKYFSHWRTVHQEPEPPMDDQVEPTQQQQRKLVSGPSSPSWFNGRKNLKLKSARTATATPRRLNESDAVNPNANAVTLPVQPEEFPPAPNAQNIEANGTPGPAAVENGAAGRNSEAILLSPPLAHSTPNSPDLFPEITLVLPSTSTTIPNPSTPQPPVAAAMAAAPAPGPSQNQNQAANGNLLSPFITIEERVKLFRRNPQPRR